MGQFCKWKQQKLFRQAWSVNIQMTSAGLTPTAQVPDTTKNSRGLRRGYWTKNPYPKWNKKLGGIFKKGSVLFKYKRQSIFNTPCSVLCLDLTKPQVTCSDFTADPTLCRRLDYKPLELVVQPKSSFGPMNGGKLKNPPMCGKSLLWTKQHKRQESLRGNAVFLQKSLKQGMS